MSHEEPKRRVTHRPRHDRAATWRHRAEPGVDPLSDLLDVVDTGIAQVSRCEVEDAWTTWWFDGVNEVRVGAVLRGQCWIGAPGGRPPMHVPMGGLFLVGPNFPFVIGTSQDDVEQLLMGAALPALPIPPPPDLPLGCEASYISLSAPVSLAALSVILPQQEIPSFVHVPPESPDAQRALRTLELLETANTRADAGSEALAGQLTRIIFAIAVRAILRDRSTPPDRYQIVADPAISAAVRLIHRQPSHPWTVVELAREVNLSRTVFARRFAVLLGVTPASYLAQWRVLIARQLMREPDRTLESIAKSVGFGSASSLIRAHKRITGETPRSVRADRRRDDPARLRPQTAGPTPQP